MLTSEYIETLHGKDRAQTESFWRRVLECIPSQTMKDTIENVYGVKGKTLNSGLGGCECKKCAGLDEDDSDCKYKGLTPAELALCTLDVALVNEYWDRPLFLYFLACEHARCKVLMVQESQNGRNAKDRAKRANQSILDRMRRGGH